MRFLITALLFLFWPTAAAFSAAAGHSLSSPASRVFTEGEELVYNVRYGFVDLGQVRILTTGRYHQDFQTTYSTIAYIDSYKGVPFVSLHAVFESLIDSMVFSRQFRGRTKENEAWNASHYVFDYGKKRVLIETSTKEGEVARRETLAVDTPYQDGLSLFFFARDRLFAGQSMAVPSLITEKKVTTYIDFTGKRENVEIDAVDYPIDAVAFEGTADFVGIFGLTGGFEGWFSNDEARIPILAKMKVIIGSVTIELMRWKRDGWAPPKAQE